MIPTQTTAPVDLLSPRPGARAVLVGLSAEEASERLRLRDAMRQRLSVDHFARAWYGGIVSLIATGILLKLNHDTLHARWLLLPVGAVCVGLWVFVVVHALHTRRFARSEQAMLTRLEGLDARAPKAPELF